MSESEEVPQEERGKKTGRLDLNERVATKTLFTKKIGQSCGNKDTN